jgi:hypothetical protein
MLTTTNYNIDPKLFQEALNQLPEGGMKMAINQPIGNFFYDPWELSQTYKGTVWETIYNSLPVFKGEARIIVLDPGQAYQSHADIDDRYHLNIQGDECYLIDLVREQMFKLEQDGTWYDMDAGFNHTAANFGRRARVQLVVRKLLKRNKIKDPVSVTINTVLDNKNHARYLFDNTLSVWLNGANKSGIISNFSYTPTEVKFLLEESHIDDLKRITPDEFTLTYE